MDRVRAFLLLSVFFSVTLLAIPFQWLLLKTGSRLSYFLPFWYHRFLTWLFGIRLHVSGKLVRDHPVLIISNHISWLDIIVISTLAPLHFVAKREVGEWPFFGMMARLQRTLFVDRERRSAVRQTAHEIAERLRQGERVVLFAEGTSSDGNQVLPFKSALIGAAAMAAGVEGKGACIQTLALAYTRLHGLPLARQQRAVVAWYGDMDMMSHVWGLLRQGPLDAHIRISEPMRMNEVGDRKHLAAVSEKRVRRDFAELITARRAAE